jgi:hypothetical protein
MTSTAGPIVILSSLLGSPVGSSLAAAAAPDEAICFLTAASVVKMETEGHVLFDPGAGHKVVTAIWESYRTLTSPEEQRICVSRADNYPDNKRVIEYIRQHPETQKRCAPEVVVRALKELYPCDQDDRVKPFSGQLDKPATSTSSSIESFPPTMGGSALHAALQSDGLDRKLAVAYISGVADGEWWSNHLAGRRYNEGAFCLPMTNAAGDVADLVRARLNTNHAEREQMASVAVYNALSARFPCPR